MLRSRNIILWLTVCWLSSCLCESDYEKGCFGDFEFDQESNSCVLKIVNSTESTTTQVPERFSYIARLLSDYNTTEDNSTVSVDVQQIAFDMVENATEIFNVTESVYSETGVIARDIVEAVNITEELNATVSQRLVSDFENSTDCVNSTVLARVLEVANETLNETEVVSRIVRNVEDVELNSTEVMNVTEVSQRISFELVNATDGLNSTDYENATRISREIVNGCKGVGSCVNGFCDKFTDDFFCICTPGYDGESCSVQTGKNIFYQHILNNTFCLETFLNETFTNTTVAYDELLINLVDRIWSEVNPEEHYMHIFDYKNITKYASLGQELQKLQVYSSISLFNFENRLSLYEQVLDVLIGYFSNSTMKEQAVNFVKEWAKSANETTGRHVLSESLVGKVRCVLNETYYLAHDLVDNYEKQVGAGETVRFGDMDHLVNSTDKSWVDVVEYGFWHVTRQLANETQVYNEKQNGKRSLPQA